MTDTGEPVRSGVTAVGIVVLRAVHELDGGALREAEGAGNGVTVVAVGIGLLGVSFAFGLTVLTMAFAIGHISGCHLNPAVTLGLVAGGRHPAKEAGGYIAAQVVGGALGAGVLYLIATGKAGADVGEEEEGEVIEAEVVEDDKAS